MAIFYTILVGIFIHKELTLKSFMASLKTTSWLTGRVLVLVFTATAFGYLLTSYRIPVEIANWILSFTNNVNLVWFFVVILLLFLGMFMETLAIIMLVTPVLLPIMTAYGLIRSISASSSSAAAASGSPRRPWAKTCSSLRYRQYFP